MHSGTEEFIRLAKHPWKFRMFLLSKLPVAWLCGVRIREMDRQHCTASVPFKRLTQNPFRSTYFACLSMAAEMSTGALAMAHLYKRQPAVSMLVVKVESEYYKKAAGTTLFTCEDGAAIEQVIEQAVKTGEAQTRRARSVGKNNQGDAVAEFFVTWSFKTRSSKTPSKP